MKWKRHCFSGFCSMKCKKQAWLPMTHIESLLTKIVIINYTALCKIQLVLKQTTTVQPTPLPVPEPPARREAGNPCAAVPGSVLPTGATKQKPAGDCPLWCEGRNRGVRGQRSRQWPRCSMVNVNACRVPRCGLTVRWVVLMLW